MNILKFPLECLESQLFVSLPLLDSLGNAFPVDFLVDTGFTGTCAIALHKDSFAFFQLFEISDIELLEKSEWLCLANGEVVKTFSAKIFMMIRDVPYQIPVRIFESKEEEPLLLGMKFLELFAKKMELDFVQKNFFVEI